MVLYVVEVVSRGTKGQQHRSVFLTHHNNQKSAEMEVAGKYDTPVLSVQGYRVDQHLKSVGDCIDITPPRQ